MRNWKAKKNVALPGNSALKHSNGYKINNSKIIFGFNYQLFEALYAIFNMYSIRSLVCCDIFTQISYIGRGELDQFLTIIP